MRTRNRFTSVVALAAAALMLLPSLALADTITNNVLVVDNDRVVSVVKGEPAVQVAWTITVDNTDPADVNGCNVGGGTTTTLTPAITAAAGASTTGVAAPSPKSASTCGAPVSFDFSATNAAVAGDYRVTVAVSGGKAGSNWDYTNAAFTLRVVNPTPSDSTAPVITPEVTGTLGSNGWYTSDVTLSWTVEDEESDVSATAGCETVTITADQHSTTYTCQATSSGGSSSESVSIKRDATAPTGLQFVNGPADGGVYFPTTVPNDGTCTADADISGLASCSITGRSTTVGSHTLTATATDGAGNAATATRTYRVRVLTLDGYFKPVDMTANVANTVKGGATVPLKFTAADEGTPLVSTAGMIFRATQVSCSTGLVEDAMTADETTTGGTQLRYDAAAEQFIQNWQTPKKAGTCWKTAMTFIDGQNLTALFKLK